MLLPDESTEQFEAALKKMMQTISPLPISYSDDDLNEAVKSNMVKISDTHSVSVLTFSSADVEPTSPAAGDKDDKDNGVPF